MWKFLADDAHCLLRDVAHGHLVLGRVVSHHVNEIHLHVTIVDISPPRTTFSSTPGAGFIITIAPWYESPFWPAREVSAMRLSRGHCGEQNRSSPALGRTPHSCDSRSRGQQRLYPCGRLLKWRITAVRIHPSVAGRPPAARRLPYKLYGERSTFFPERAAPKYQNFLVPST